MKTFFMTFEVVPTVSNEHYSIVKGALAHCWVLENNRQSAYAKASFFVSKYDWKIEKMDTFPVETTEEHFLEKDLGLEQYIKAQEEGIAIIYTGWARDEKSNIGPIEFKPSFKFNLAEFIKKQKRMRNKGRCLHYDGGHRCGKIINAHSIQKNQSLSAIAENGHVYKLSSDISTLKKIKEMLNT